VRIYKLEETKIGKFGLELKELMIKHEIESITPLHNEMEISVSESGQMVITGVNFKEVKESERIAGTNTTT
jgi:hypothetical protein